MRGQHCRDYNPSTINPQINTAQGLIITKIAHRPHWCIIFVTPKLDYHEQLIFLVAFSRGGGLNIKFCSSTKCDISGSW